MYIFLYLQLKYIFPPGILRSFTVSEHGTCDVAPSILCPCLYIILPIWSICSNMYRFPLLWRNNEWNSACAENSHSLWEQSKFLPEVQHGSNCYITKNKLSVLFILSKALLYLERVEESCTHSVINRNKKEKKIFSTC